MKDGLPCKSRLNRLGLLSNQVKRLFTNLLCIGALATITWAAVPGPSRQSQPANIDTETIQFDSNGIEINAYIARPNSAGKHPAVIVIHDDQGLTDSFREIANQLASAGFVALAPDLTSRLGASKTPAEAARALNQISPELTVRDLAAGFAFLQKDPGVETARISSVGFGWGGWRSFMMATLIPELHRAIVYSGATPAQGLENAHASILANYAQYDFRTTGNALWTEKVMREAGKKFSYYVYPNVYRAFYNNATPQFNAEAAKLAWTRTLDFLSAP